MSQKPRCWGKRGGKGENKGLITKTKDAGYETNQLRARGQDEEGVVRDPTTRAITSGVKRDGFRQDQPASRSDPGVPNNKKGMREELGCYITFSSGHPKSNERHPITCYVPPFSKSKKNSASSLSSFIPPRDTPHVSDGLLGLTTYLIGLLAPA